MEVSEIRRSVLEACCVLEYNNVTVGTGWICQGKIISAGHCFYDTESKTLPSPNEINKHAIYGLFFVSNVEKRVKLEFLEGEYNEALYVDYSVLQPVEPIEIKDLPISYEDCCDGDYYSAGNGVSLNQLSNVNGTLEGYLNVPNGSRVLKLQSQDGHQFGISGAPIFSKNANGVVGIQSHITPQIIGPESKTIIAFPIKTLVDRKILKCSNPLLESIREKNQKIINQNRKGRPIYPELFAPVSNEDGKEYDSLTEAVFAVTDQLRETKPIILTARGGQGKTTQMISLLESLNNHKNEHDIYDCFTVFCKLSDYEQSKNLVHDILYDNYHIIEESEQNIVIKGMKRQYDDSKHHFFLLLDGLDETNTDVINSIRKFAQEENNVQIIIAGRSNGLYLGRETINMALKDLRPEKVEQWLRKNHEGKRIAGARISNNPMLLILACEVTNNLQRYDENTHYVGINSKTPLKLGEVLWNYSEYLLRKACLYEGITYTEKQFAVEFMHSILPYIAYNYFFAAKEKYDRYELKKTLKHYNITYINTDEAFETISKTCTGILHYVEEPGKECFVFDHKLFIEYYSMMYISILVEKSTSSELTENEYRIIGNFELLDNYGYVELLIYTLPFCFELYNLDYRRKFISILDKTIQDSSMTEAQIQVLSFIRAMYTLWDIEDCKKDKEESSKELSDAGWKAYEYMTDFIKVAEKGLVLQIDCLSYIYYILSQLYRVGEIFPSKKRTTLLYEFAPNLNKSFEMTYKAIKLGEKSKDVIDGYNYLGHLFSAACDMILKAFYEDPEKTSYELSENDLIMNLSDDPCVFDFKLADHIPSDVAKAKPGDILKMDKIKARIQCFTNMTRIFFQKGEKKGGVLSLNVLALAEDQRQEKKPQKDRDYTSALQLFLKAATIERSARFYSAQKAAQILAQKKAGLTDEDIPCSPEYADQDKTCEKVTELLEIAASANPETWGMNRFYRGQMLLNYCNNGSNALDYNSAIKEAYDEHVFALRILGSIKTMPLLLGLLKTGLEMIKISDVENNEINNVVQSSIQNYPKLLSSLIQRAQQPPRKNEWTPSYYIVKEYIDEIKTLADQYKDEIQRVSLADDMSLCINKAYEFEEQLEKWNQNKGKYQSYYELLEETAI